MAKSEQRICMTAIENILGQGISMRKCEFFLTIVNMYLFRDFWIWWPLVYKAQLAGVVDYTIYICAEV